MNGSDCFGKPINAIAAQLVGLKGSTVTLRLRKVLSFFLLVS